MTRSLGNSQLVDSRHSSDNVMCFGRLIAESRRSLCRSGHFEFEIGISGVIVVISGHGTEVTAKIGSSCA